MTGIDGIAASSPTQPSPQAGLGDMDGEAFLNLLVAQMRYQDPMNPSEPTEMMQQTAMFAQVEALTGIQDLQQEMVGFHQGAMATNLVGQHVTGRDEAGSSVEGLVESVRFTPEGPRLQVGDREIALVDATEVGLPPAT